MHKNSPPTIQPVNYTIRTFKHDLLSKAVAELISGELTNFSDYSAKLSYIRSLTFMLEDDKNIKTY